MSSVWNEILRDYEVQRWGRLKLFVKALRLVAFWPDHRAWLRVLRGPVTRVLLAEQPRIAYRSSSQYLFAGTGYRTRLRFLRAHYAFVNAHCDAGLFAAMLRPDGLCLWQLRRDGHAVAACLVGPAAHREGELGLAAVIDGVVVFRLWFSVLPADEFLEVDPARRRPRRVFYIGQVQGVQGQADPIRCATQVCDAIAPQDLLMCVVAGLAKACDVDCLLAVGIGRHLSARKMALSQAAFDYETFWKRYGSVPSRDGHHVIRVPFAQKPIREIVARHRKRTMVKRRLKESIVQDVESRVATASTPVRG